MIKGLIHGMLWGAIVIPESDKEMWDHLRDKSRRLLNLDIMDERSHNLPPALGLAAFINKDQDLRHKYEKAYAAIKNKLSGYSFDTTFYWRGSADWSGVNLGLVGDISAITIADKLGAAKIRDKLRERLMDSWVTYSPSQRHLLTMVAYGFAYAPGTRGGNFKDESSEEKFRAALNQSIWGLREMPYPRPNLDVEIDHSLRPDWCISPIPRLFWKSLKRPEPPITYFYQGLYNYPTFELDAYTSNFVWKEAAFMFKGDHSRGAEYAGVDYLYGYWLARYVGVPNVD
jgi:hypothetical protein